VRVGRRRLSDFPGYEQNWSAGPNAVRIRAHLRGSRTRLRPGLYMIPLIVGTLDWTLLDMTRHHGYIRLPDGPVRSGLRRCGAFSALARRSTGSKSSRHNGRFSASARSSTPSSPTRRRPKSGAAPAGGRPSARRLATCPSCSTKRTLASVEEKLMVEAETASFSRLSAAHSHNKSSTT